METNFLQIITTMKDKKGLSWAKLSDMLDRKSTGGLHKEVEARHDFRLYQQLVEILGGSILYDPFDPSEIFKDIPSRSRHSVLITKRFFRAFKGTLTVQIMEEDGTKHILEIRE